MREGEREGEDRREGEREFVRVSLPIPDISPVSHASHDHSFLTRKLVSSGLKLDDGIALFSLIISSNVCAVTYTTECHT